MHAERNRRSLKCAWLNIPGESPWQQKRKWGRGTGTRVERGGLQEVAYKLVDSLKNIGPAYGRPTYLNLPQFMQRRKKQGELYAHVGFEARRFLITESTKMKGSRW
jgi:hypothetical protein